MGERQQKINHSSKLKLLEIPRPRKLHRQNSLPSTSHPLFQTTPEATIKQKSRVRKIAEEIDEKLQHGNKVISNSLKTDNQLVPFCYCDMDSLTNAETNSNVNKTKYVRKKRHKNTNCNDLNDKYVNRTNDKFKKTGEEENQKINRDKEIRNPSNDYQLTNDVAIKVNTKQEVSTIRNVPPFWIYGNKSFVNISNVKDLSENKTLPGWYRYKNNNNNNTDNEKSSSDTTSYCKNKFIKNSKPSKVLKKKSPHPPASPPIDISKLYNDKKESEINDERTISARSELTEIYRKSILKEFDREIENMKNDGFDEHLSMENLTLLSVEDLSDGDDAVFVSEYQDVILNSKSNAQTQPQMCIINNPQLVRSTSSSSSSDNYYEINFNANEETKIQINHQYPEHKRQTYFDKQGIIRIERFGTTQADPSTNRNHNNGSVTEDVNKLDDQFVNNVNSLPMNASAKKMLRYIAEELIVTEYKYVNDITKVINDYRDFIYNNCPEKASIIFGNLKVIRRYQRNLLMELEHCGNDINRIALTFLNYEDLFKLYPVYFKNTPRANAAIKQLSALIKERQKELNEKLDISAYLLTPLQRLGKYLLFLENIIKQLLKMENDESSSFFLIIDNTQRALKMIKNYMRKGNDVVAIDSIAKSPIKSSDYGSFIMREKCLLIKPKRMEIVVFLFRNVIVLTTINDLEKDFESFVYWKHIKMDDLRIATYEEDTTIQLTDFTKTTKHNSTKHTYIIDLKTDKIKIIWKKEIEDILWKQLKKQKDDLEVLIKKTPITINTKKIVRVKSTGASQFYD